MSKSKTNRIDYLLEVVDRFSRPLKEFNNRVDDALRPIRKVKHALASLGRESGFDRVAKSAGRARKQMGEIASTAGLVGGAIVAGLSGAGYVLHSTAEELAQLRSQADSVGMDPRNLMAYGAAVKELGFDYEKVVDLVEEMNNKIGESKGLEQTTPVKEALAMLRLDFAAIARMKPEEQFERIMTAAGAMADQQKAVSAVDILMGGEANKIMGHLRAMAAEQGKTVDQVLDRYKQLNLLSGVGVERFKHFSRATNDLFAVMGSGFKELLSGLAGKLVPLIKRGTKWIVANFDAIKARAGELLDGFDPSAFLAGAREVWSVLSGVASVIGSVVSALGGLRGAFILLGALIGAKLVLALGGLATAFYSLGAAIMTTPVGWIMAAIAGITVAAIALIRNWDSVKSFFSGFFSSIAKAMSRVAGAITAPFRAAFDWIAGKLSWLADAARAVGSWFGIGDEATSSAPASGEYSAAAARAGQINEQRYSSENVTRQESRLAVDFTGVPQGARVSREGDAPMDMSLGWAMATDFG